MLLNNLVFLFCAVQEAAKTEKRTSVTNEEPFFKTLINKKNLYWHFLGTKNCWNRTNEAVCVGKLQTLHSGRSVLSPCAGGQERVMFADEPAVGLSSSPATSAFGISVQCNYTWGKKKTVFLNVRFKDSSSAFHVFGCFFFMCVQVLSSSRTFAWPPKYNKA